MAPTAGYNSIDRGAIDNQHMALFMVYVRAIMRMKPAW
jgi:hypothetical protein